MFRLPLLKRALRKALLLKGGLYSLQPRLAQVGISAVAHGYILLRVPSLPRIQRESRANTQNFGCLRPRLVLAAHLSIVNDELSVSRPVIGKAGEGALEHGNRLLIPPHLGVGPAFVEQVAFP